MNAQVEMLAKGPIGVIELEYFVFALTVVMTFMVMKCGYCYWKRLQS